MKIPLLRTTRQTSPHTYGMIVILLGGLFFSVMSLGVRMSRDLFRSDTLVFYRSLCQTLVLLPWLRSYFAKGTIREKFVAHFPRGAFGIISMIFLYIALQRLPMGLTYLLAMTSVPWATVLARVFLKEKLSRSQVWYGLLACAGVVIALIGSESPSKSWAIDFLGVVCALLCGGFMGLALVVLRRLRRAVDAAEIAFFFGVTGLVFSLPYFLSQPEFPRSALDVGHLLWIGLAGSCGQVLMTVGFRYTDTMTASIAHLGQTIPTLLLGFYFLGEIPPLGFFIGSVVMVAGILGLLTPRRAP